ncbi:MAG: NADH-ubiquinone oxidoreductase-F iron-sulfur binding region domain-containing protein [Bacteroidales bacterium]
MLDMRPGYDLLREQGLTLGSGAVVVLDEHDSVFGMLDNILHFFSHVSCGKCVPCRIGTKQLLLLMDEIHQSGNPSVPLPEKTFYR